MCVCVCVCMCAYIYIYIYCHPQTEQHLFSIFQSTVKSSKIPCTMVILLESTPSIFNSFRLDYVVKGRVFANSPGYQGSIAD